VWWDWTGTNAQISNRFHLTQSSFRSCAQESSDLVQRQHYRLFVVPHFHHAFSTPIHYFCLFQIAEGLYQKGFISYPRTETTFYPADMDLRGLVQHQTTNSQWGTYSQQLLDGGFKAPRAGKSNDKAHPPIHPTKAGDNLSGNEGKVYELITRHFLA
jgi:hypothetical protein